MRKVPMTIDGAERLREELSELKTVQRPKNYPGHCRGP